MSQKQEAPSRAAYRPEVAPAHQGNPEPMLWLKTAHRPREGVVVLRFANYDMREPLALEVPVAEAMDPHAVRLALAARGHLLVGGEWWTHSHDWPATLNVTILMTEGGMLDSHGRSIH